MRPIGILLALLTFGFTDTYITCQDNSPDCMEYDSVYADTGIAELDLGDDSLLISKSYYEGFKVTEDDEDWIIELLPKEGKSD